MSRYKKFSINNNNIYNNNINTNNNPCNKSL